MTLFINDRRFEEVRRELNSKGDGLEIVPVKDALDRISAKVDDIYENVLRGNEDGVARATWHLDAEDAADLMLCAMHLIALGELKEDDVMNSIETSLRTYYNEDPYYYAKPNPKKRGTATDDNRDRVWPSDDNVIAGLLFSMLFESMKHMRNQDDKKWGGEDA